MYQSAYYCYDEYKYYLRDSEKGWSSFKYQPTLYVKDDQGDFETLEGDRVRPIKKVEDWKNPKYFEKDVEKITRLLVDAYYEEDDPPKNHNLVYLDIECEVFEPLNAERIKEAPTKITSISLYDEQNKKYICFILDEQNHLKHETKDNKEIIPINNEIDLLVAFLNEWEELDPTIITGWNSGFFDIPYLYYRIKKQLGEHNALRLSPIGKVRFQPFDYEQPLKLGGINHLDYLLLFKKYVSKQEPSYKLNDIGIKYVELGKIDYEGSLDKLYNENKEKFIEYNIRDTEILVALEDKLKFIDLTVIICHLCHVEYEQIFHSTALNEGAILTYLKRKNIVSPNKPTTYNPSLKDIKEKYAGGYLKEPIPGLYEWVIDLDFTSLYPSIIRSLNMGVETLVGRVVNKDKYDNQWSLRELKQLDKDQIIEIEKVNKKREIIKSQTTVENLLNIIEANNYIISAPGVIFRKDRQSVVCDVLADWFLKRQEYKKLMKKAYKENNPVKGELYNRRQHAYKIKLNDVYGVYSINGWRYTDGNKFISKAITLTGQRLLQESIQNMNNYINKLLKNTHIQDYIITSDTDSMFINVKDLLLNQFPNIDLNKRDEVIPKILNIAHTLQNEANQFLHVLVKELFNVDTKHFFELKQEVILERGYFAGKRRYAQFIVNKEGIPVEELDMKGLDLMKSNFPPLFKQFGENIIKQIMFGKSKDEIDNQILEFKESLSNIEWKKLLKPTGLKKLKEYIKKYPDEGEIFSQLVSKCPINTKAAIYYNDLLKYWKLNKKYSLFQVGDKMNIVYLKENPYRINCVGLNGYKDPPEILKLVEEYVDRESIFDAVMKNKIKGLYDDIKWEQPVYNKKIYEFFKF